MMITVALFTVSFKRPQLEAYMCPPLYVKGT